METQTRRFGNFSIARFVWQDEKVRLCELGGLTCGECGEDNGPAAARGLFLLETNLGRFEADDLKLIENRLTEKQVDLTWQTIDGTIRIDSQWIFESQTGIWSRQERITNISNEPVTIFKSLSRFVFSPGRYEIYSQGSRWCTEHQGRWQPPDHGTITLAGEQARTCQGGTPYLFLRQQDGQRGIAFYIKPCGDWMIRICSQPVGNDSLPFAVVEMGPKTESLHFKLEAKQTFELPELLIQQVASGEPESAAPFLHQYLLEETFSAAKPFAPVVYNTWFDDFDFLKVDRLHRQLKSAKEIGCEVFVIDAGWYGPNPGNWWVQTGDWREKIDGGFCGKMKAFADQVRAAGLGFGLWMEPERACFDVPAVKEHPDWFVRGPQGCYPNLQKKEGYDYIFSEICRLVEQYELAWMKIDFNHHLGIDPTGMEFAGYYQAWYRLLDSLREKYPSTFFEACSSGGMRSDVHTLAHHDGHFLTDTVEPIDVIRIYQGALLRLVPGRLTKWVTLRSVGRTVPRYGSPLETVSETLVTPGGATWDTANTVDVDFAIRACMPGMMGFSGDLTDLPLATLDRMKFHIEYFKRWRAMITGSIGHLLTPVRSIEDRGGWIGLQLQRPIETTSLVFAYRLDDMSPKIKLQPRGLKPDQKYRIRNIDQPEESVRLGSDLMNEGIIVELAAKYRAAVIEVISI